ncbi:cation:proton antiporter [Sodalinema sp.]|uniref:cation:proton antiporter domain-containing protein n=1 Tax=Sodalinema sp. TaxID=3080550 RepID=UPI00396F588E
MTLIHHLPSFEPMAEWGATGLPFLAQVLSPIEDPVAIFLIILAIMLVAPLLFERFKMPGIIGLILAGVVVGPHGLGVLELDSTIDLLGTVGLLFLMFLGGLETSLEDLRQNARGAITFGLATFLLPMIIGTAAILMLDYSLLAAILVASTFASHTLVALPVLSRLGIMKSRVVTSTLGATLITNVLALLVLAVVVKAEEGELTLEFWLFLIPSLIIYTFATLWGIPKLGRWFFVQFGHDDRAEFTFVLAALFVVSYLANLIQIEPIVGAFLAGVAITPLVPQLSPLMNRIQFIGNTLFVPFFLISVGMLVDPMIFIQEPEALLVAGVMVGAEVVSKLAAAWGSGWFLKWSGPGRMVGFGLSIAQAASTLAAATVALDIGLVDDVTINGVILMILVTSIASPWITARWGAQLDSPQLDSSDTQDSAAGHNHWGARILVPVANPNTEDRLLQLAIILAKRGQGTLLPLHVLSDRGGPVSAAAQAGQKRLLSTAEMIAHGAVVAVEPIGRVDDSIDWGILRVAQERNASLVICGWKGYSTYRENFFGGVIDNVVRQSSVPVLVSRFPKPLENIQRVRLAVTDAQAVSSLFKPTLTLARSVADELKSDLGVLQVIPSRAESPRIDLSDLQPEVDVEVNRGGLVIQVITVLEPNDLLVLIAGKNRAGGSALGRTAETIARSQPNASMLILHFPDPL